MPGKNIQNPLQALLSPDSIKENVNNFNFIKLKKIKNNIKNKLIKYDCYNDRIFICRY